MAVRVVLLVRRVRCWCTATDTYELPVILDTSSGFCVLNREGEGDDHPGIDEHRRTRILRVSKDREACYSGQHLGLVRYYGCPVASQHQK